MKRYIDKAAVVAELERQRKIYMYDVDNRHSFGRMMACNDLLVFLDTLEVKEVNLEKEIDDYINEHFSECEDGVLISDANSKELTLLDVTPMAKYFYELGLKKGE